jgi:hypothetical protein
MVLDTDYEPGSASSSALIVVVELVSDTDHTPVPGEKEPWIGIKRRLYLAHPACVAVVQVRSLPRRDQRST